VSSVPDGLRTHAAAIAERELRRRGSTVASLSPEERARVEVLVSRIAAEVVEGVLEHARGAPAVASALASIYGAEQRLLVESAPETAV
jgi:hypothetical protein